MASDNQRKNSVVKSDSNHVRNTHWVIIIIMYVHTCMQTNIKLECKRADIDMEQLRQTLEEEKHKLKIEKEVGQILDA